MKRSLTLAALSITMVGCAGMKYAMDNYSGVTVTPFSDKQGRAFRIFDKPAESRMMITPSSGDASLGAFSQSNSAVLYRDASAEFLASTGRDCNIKDTTLIVQPQYEVRYQCKETQAASAAASPQ